MAVMPHFFHELIGLISAARMVSDRRGVSLAEASDYVENELIKAGVLIYTKCLGRSVEMVGEAWFAPACDFVGDALSKEWWNNSEKLQQPIFPGDFLPDELAITWVDATRLLGIDDNVEAPKPIGNVGLGMVSRELDNVAEIRGPTFSRLQRVISAFPVRYPDFKAKPPKLNDDVRLWLKEVGLAENDAEQRVFGAIIREHFKLSPDTQKT